MKLTAVSILLLALSACSTTHNLPVPHDSLPNRFDVSVGGAMGSAYSVQLADDHLRYTASSGPHFAHPRVLRITPSADQWAAFWREAQAVDLWHWRSSYELTPPDVVCDGTQWHIDISYNGQSVRSSGDNAYPSDATPTKTGIKVAEPTQRFQRFTLAVRKLIGGRTFE
jgi:hypothetical protein